MGLIPKDIIVEQVRVGAAKHLDGLMLHNLTLETYPAHIGKLFDGLILKIKTDVWAEKIPPEMYSAKKVFKFYAPASWWDMFKDEHKHSHWLGWINRRWPAKFRTVSEEVTISVALTKAWLYPNASLITPGWGAAVRHHEINYGISSKRVYD